MRSLLRIGGLMAMLCFAPALPAAVFINEFLVHNPGRPDDPDARMDMDNDSPGWVELRNNGASAVQLTGWALSDDPAVPGKWVFAAPVAPASTHTSIAASGYLVVFCSGKPRNIANVQPHTSFKLNDSGFIQLSQPDGGGGWTVVSRFGTPAAGAIPAAPYPDQQNAISYGYPNNDPQQAPVYFLSDTPAASNAASGVTEFCGDTHFSVDRGLYDAQFTVEVTTDTPGATIVYTTNGSVPTLTNGTQAPPADALTAPVASINITGTTVLRARALKTGLGSSDIDTQTYLFPAQILTQNGPPASMGLGTYTAGKTNPLPALTTPADLLNPSVPWGFASENGRSNGTATTNGPDWAVDPEIAVPDAAFPNRPANVAGSRLIEDDFKSIPTVSLVTDWKGLFGPNSSGQQDGGIYPPAPGLQLERVDRTASVEYINPDGSTASPNARKGFQVDGRFHVFGGTSQQRWKSYKLSMSFKCRTDVDFNIYGDDATPQQDVLILDARLNQVWLHPDGVQRTRGDYVRDHVMADLQHQLGGVSFHTRPVHLYLNGTYWGLYLLHEKPDHRIQSRYRGGDADDYDVFKHTIIGSSDNIVNTQPLSWATAVSTSLPAAAGGAPAGFLNATCAWRFEEMLDTIGIGNSAPNPTVDLTVRANFEAAAAKIDIPDLIKYMLLNFTAANSDWAHQNYYASLKRSDPAGKWRWHSWDAEHVFRAESESSVGNDNLAERGPTAIHQRLKVNREYQMMFADAVQKHVFNNGVLSTTNVQAVFTKRLNEIDGAIRGESARWGDNRYTGGAMNSGNMRYTRAGFPGAPTTIVNGQAKPICWLTEKERILTTVVPVRCSTVTSTGSSVVNQLRGQGLMPSLPGTSTFFAGPAFQNAANNAAQHGGAVPSGFQLKIHNPNAPISGGTTTLLYSMDGSDPREMWTSATAFGGATAAGALTYSAAVPLTMSGVVKARIRHVNATSVATWSPLTEAHFSVDTVPASETNLVVSKIHYRPAAPTAAEIALGFDRRSTFEFIELMNVSASAVRLDGVSFGSGLDYTFNSASSVRELVPGARVLVVANRLAFESRHGTSLPVAGEFQLDSNLDDSGERISITAADGVTAIKDFSYNDKAPWPIAPDGEGFSLVLRSPSQNTSSAAHGNPLNWRASRDAGSPGEDANSFPGEDDRESYATWQAAQFTSGAPLSLPGDDADFDGLMNFMEFSLRSSPLSGLSPAVVISSGSVAVDPDGIAGPLPADLYPAVTFTRRAAVEQIVWTPRTSSNLSEWFSGPDKIVPVGGAVAAPNGMETITFRSTTPLSAASRQYFTLQAVYTP